MIVIMIGTIHHTNTILTDQNQRSNRPLVKIQNETKNVFAL